VPTIKLSNWLALVGLLMLGGCASNQPPAETHDGLVLQADSKADQLYLRPGVDFSGYREFGLVPCQVAFRKNWLRDQNSNRMSLSKRVTQKDVDKIKDTLAAGCDEQFRAALLAEPPYTLVEEFDEGQQVLVVRPAIINLDIAAPDIMTAGMSRSYTTEAGQMTMYVELLDATTGEILARAVDRRRAADTGRLTWTNGVTNGAEANRMLRRWAEQLRKGLDSAIGK